MKRILTLLAVTSCTVFAQDKVFFEQNAMHTTEFDRKTRQPVQGAPYSATIVTENIQTLGDGNRIVQKSTATVARDSAGRTRQDTILPMIGGMSAANAPHLVSIMDPVAQTAFTLNLDEKTASKNGIAFATTAMRRSGVPGGDVAAAVRTFSVTSDGPGGDQVAKTLSVTVPDGGFSGNEAGIAVKRNLQASNPQIRAAKLAAEKEQSQMNVEKLGVQTIEGVPADGIRMTRTIPAGQIGNDKPIESVTEIWTSVELKTVVYSKRSDPRTGEQTFRLTNIDRSEPAASLFTVPADFKVVEPDGPGNFVFYRTKE